MPFEVQAGSTDQSFYFFMKDSVTGEPETGITITDLDIQYVRFGETPSAKVDLTALGSVGAAHADNQGIEVDSTDQPGLYRVDFPDAAFASGAPGVILTVKGDGFQPAHKEIQITSGSPQLTGSSAKVTPSSYVLTTGTESSGSVASTAALNGTSHEHTDDAGAMDLYYEFLIGSGTPTSATLTGYLNSANDDLEVYGYDWNASAWVRIGTLNGKNSATTDVLAFDLLVDMVGTGSDLGKVRIRFTDGAFTLTSATLAVDQLFVENTNITNENTVPGVDGTSTNPVSTVAAVNTLSASLNIDKFQVAPGSSITFADSQENQAWAGENWVLALGGESISGTHIYGADVTGIATGASEPEFNKCHFGDATLPPSHLLECGFQGTITMGSAGTFFFDTCHSMVAGTNTPVLDFGAALNSSNVGVAEGAP
jgi:hypothetical protein